MLQTEGMTHTHTHTQFFLYKSSKSQTNQQDSSSPGLEGFNTQQSDKRGRIEPQQLAGSDEADENKVLCIMQEVSEAYADC